jgi:xanthine dehydrogenase accessory factor
MTDDPETILRFAAGGDAASALVTLVEIRGGAARALGAQMAVRSDGSFMGYISGGCVEAAVAAEALAAMEHGSDRFLLLGEGSPFFDIVLPCGGGITLAIHIVRDPVPLRAAINDLVLRRRTALRYDPSRQSISRDEPSSTCWSSGMFFVRYRPVPRLMIASSSIEAEAVTKLATAAGYSIAEDTAEIDEDTAVLLLLHDLDREEALLDRALDSDAFYIGALGSKRTHERRCKRLLDRGYSPDQISRIKGPIGLFGPARTASALALSVLADIASIRGD